MIGPKDISLLVCALVSAGVGVSLGGLLAALNMPLEGGASAVLGLGLLYLYLDRRHLPGLLIGPSSFLYLYHALGYAIGPLAQRYVVHSERFIQDGMVLAQWGAVLGLATFALVFGQVFRAVVARVDHGKDARHATPTGSRWTGYTLLLLATTLLLLRYTFGTVGSRIGGSPVDVSTLSQTLVSSFWFVQIVSFFFLGAVAFRRRGWAMALAIVMYVAYAAFETLEGNRGPALSALLMLVNGAVWAGVSARKTILTLALSTLVFVPVGGIVDRYRSVTVKAQYEEGLLSRAAAFIDAARTLNTAVIDETVNRYQAVIYAISAIVVDRAMVMTPNEIPYAGFEDLSALFYIYIPRAIAPDRPGIDDGNRIAAKYGIGLGTTQTYYYTPSVAEGYRRFGWAGIPLLYGLSALVLGAAVGVCWAKRRGRVWMALLMFLVTQAPGVWTFTFNYLFYFAFFYVPKYFIYFLSLSKLQDLLGSFHRAIVRSARHEVCEAH